MISFHNFWLLFLGWFTQSDEPHCKKEYNYQYNLNNTNYVEWHERETRGKTVKERLSLVYVAQPYLTAVSVTEKRNLVWDLRLVNNFDFGIPYISYDLAFCTQNIQKEIVLSVY